MDESNIEQAWEFQRQLGHLTDSHLNGAGLQEGLVRGAGGAR